MHTESRQGRWWKYLLLAIGLLALLAGLGGWAMIAMPGHSYRGAPVPLNAAEMDLRHRLARHVQHLAGTIGERHIWRAGSLEAAAHYLETTWQQYGYTVARQAFEAQGQQVTNLEVELPGAARRQDLVVVGGHYDSVVGSPGANDNATGTAAVLELARLLAGQSLACTVRLVAFVNEEQPFARTDTMGSRVYARRSRQRGEHIVAMLSLETMGYYSTTAHSQHYPKPLHWFYPHTGNFIGFVANTTSRSLVRHSLASFRQHTAFPSEGVAAPGWLPGIGWSDHWSFWQEGYPGVMITDTAPFRYPYYHAPADTPAQIHYDHLARVVTGLARVVVSLAGGSGSP